jgi:hypothetical protein
MSGKEKMVADLMQLFDDGTTMTDILKGLGMIESERARKRRNYKPTGRPAGRPRKESLMKKDNSDSD